MQYIVAYIAAAVFFLAVDFVWLARVAKSFYFDRLGDLVRKKPRMGAAAGFYVVFVLGIVYFSIVPAIEENAISTAAINGALFGFFTYATYDMTNYATLRHWPRVIVVVDIAWGTFLSSAAAIVGYGAQSLI